MREAEVEVCGGVVCGGITWGAVDDGGDGGATAIVLPNPVTSAAGRAETDGTF